MADQELNVLLVQIFQNHMEHQDQHQEDGSLVGVEEEHIEQELQVEMVVLAAAQPGKMVDVLPATIQYQPHKLILEGVAVELEEMEMNVPDPQSYLEDRELLLSVMSHSS